MATLPNPGRRSSNGASLNLAMAGLAAVALAFFTYAMPDDIFSGLVARSGLPSLIAAAEPPLGMKARGAVIAVGAILAFAAVLMLFRALDRISARPAKAKAEAEVETPRLRRADAHPDAPARRPLLAGRDLGDYVEPEEDESFPPPPAGEKFADLEVRPLPGFLAPEQAEARPAAAEEPLILDRPHDEAGFDSLVSQLPDIGDVAGDESITDLMRRLESGLSSREPAAGSNLGDPEPVAVEPEPVPAEPEFMPHYRDTPAAPAVQASEPEPVAPLAEEVSEAEELEPPVAETPDADEIDYPVLHSPEAEASEVRPEVEPQIGHRLRSTIGGLHRIAGRG
jgi:hypothetical protein